MIRRIDLAVLVERIDLTQMIIRVTTPDMVQTLVRGRKIPE